MDALREGVYLRSYAQKDPLIEYKTEAYDMFVELMANIKNEVLHNLFRSTSNLAGVRELSFPPCRSSCCASTRRPRRPPTVLPRAGARSRRRSARAKRHTGEENGDGDEVTLDLAPVRRELPKVGRNEPCPCGSGKKFKNCCGRTA